MHFKDVLVILVTYQHIAYMIQQGIRLNTADIADTTTDTTYRIYAR